MTEVSEQKRLGDRIVALTTERDDYILALKGIVKLGGLALLGGRDMESDRAYEAGANAAFGQAAEMARSALQRQGDE